MAYKINILLLCFTLLLQGCLVGAFSKAQLLFYSSVSEEEFHQWAESLCAPGQKLNTIRNFHNWGVENMHWVQDSFSGMLDYPRDPLIVLKRKRGDCDDYASLFSNGLIYLGIPCMIMAVQYKYNGKKRGHAVTVVNIYDKYYHISNWKNIKFGLDYGVFGPYNSLEEAAHSIGGKDVLYYELWQPENFKIIIRRNLK